MLVHAIYDEVCARGPRPCDLHVSSSDMCFEQLSECILADGTDHELCQLCAYMHACPCVMLMLMLILMLMLMLMLMPTQG